MVSTTVLLTITLSSFALIAGAFYALVAVIAGRLDRLENRFDRFEAAVNERFDRLESDVAALKMSVAVLESRLPGD